MPICFVTNLTIGQLSRAYLLCICFFGVIVFFGVGYFLETALRLCAGVLRRDLGCTAKVVSIGVCRASSWLTCMATLDCSYCSSCCTPYMGVSTIFGGSCVPIKSSIGC